MKRKARQSQPQLVCIVADNSDSMAGEKAKAATQGIHEMLTNAQTRGPQGVERSSYRLLLIRFSNDAKIAPGCDMTPVRQIDPQTIEVCGDGGQTNITAALQLTRDRLAPYMKSLQERPENAEHPLPLVLLYSDGEHNVGDSPAGVAAEIKGLNLDGDPVVIVCAGIAVGKAHPDEATLREIASPECYFPATELEKLTRFLAEVGSSGLSSAPEIARMIKEEFSE
jgi:uncharacterized protein YegL